MQWWPNGATIAVGWDEDRAFLDGTSSRSHSRAGAWVLTHLPAGPRPASGRYGAISIPSR